MKKIITLAAAMTTVAMVSASPLWMRYNVISPDGEKIAFSYQGDIYVVPVDGGDAEKIVGTEAYEFQPVWSPDSKTLAFASNKNGNFDVYSVSLDGGNPVRLTTNSAYELPLGFDKDGKSVLYNAGIVHPSQSAQFPASWKKELYKVSLNGGRPEMIFGETAMNLALSPDGTTIYYEKATGSENNWRKHHVSSVARNIWSYDTKTQEHKQLTTNPGEDRNPAIGQDGKIYFLSERDHESFNVFVADPDNMEQVTALTENTPHPVRFLSVADNGTISYGYMGEIYTKKPGEEPKKVEVKMRSAIDPDSLKTIPVRGQWEYDMTPDGSQIIFVARGDVFAVTDKYPTTKQVTETPAAESGISIDKDGRKIVFASERSGKWALYTAELAREGEVNFANATTIKEEPLFKDEDVERFAPKFSPDGKQVAFIQDRTKLMVLDLKTKKVRQITDGSKNYRNDDYGFDYSWSPDGKWFVLTVIANTRDPYSDIAIVSASGDGEYNLVTQSAYIDGSPRWALDGNAITFVSNRLGMRSHASWGSQNDVFIAYLNQETYDKFRLSQEDYDLKKDEEKRLKELEAKKADKKKDSKKKEETKEADENQDIEIDLDKLEDRIVRLTPMSSNLSSAILSKDGETLYFVSTFEGKADLWSLDIRERTSKILSKGVGYVDLVLDKDGKYLYAFGSSSKKIDTKTGRVEPLATGTTMVVDLAGEREYMFNHVFSQQKKRFYRTDYHGVDLDKLREDYLPFLPFINNNYDFAEMLSEILGELNVSHTGSGYRYSPESGAERTANLGLFFNDEYTGDGLLIDEVVENSPFDTNYSKVEKGCIIEKIDGVEIKEGEDYYPLLKNKTGKKVLVTIRNPQTKEEWEEVIKPISAGAFDELLYQRWVKSRKEETERLSGGRLGYVHIRSMGDKSYREVYSDVLGRYNHCDGVVIDTRFNGGGRLHEDIEILFSGEKYLEQMIRGVRTCDMPSRRYNKPSIMLVAEANYSNAHGTPWVYKYKNIGSVVGMPVPGTMTSVNWETLQDPSLYFGIPVVGYLTQDGEYLENLQLEPDFKVDNDINSVMSGQDKQLEVAVEELLKQIDAEKATW